MDMLAVIHRFTATVIPSPHSQHNIQHHPKTEDQVNDCLYVCLCVYGDDDDGVAEKWNAHILE